MNQKLTSIVGGATLDKQRQALRDLQASLQIILESQQAMAQITRAKYLSLMEQGFTAEQALELCK